MEHKKREGILVVISGFAGTGKGSVVARLRQQFDNYALSVSATTREPRQGEMEGVHYFFKTREAFEAMIAAGDLLEYAQYVGNFYGTPKDYVARQLAEGRDVILEIEMQGALEIREKFPGALLLFIAPPDAKTLRQRLEMRGTETRQAVERRLARAAEETAYMERYDYLVVNDELETCVREVHAIIQSEHNRVSRCKPFIKALQEDFHASFR